MKSIQPRNQRREYYNAPLHKRRKWAAAHLDENLLLKYDRRSMPVIKGDTVRVMRGSYRGHEDKVAKIDLKKRFIEIEGLIMTKADGKKIAKPIHPSNVMITKLNLTDKWRRGKLERGLSEEAKKEIEKEAETQIKEREEEERRRKAEEEAAAKAAEEEAELDEDLEEEIIEEPEEKPEKPKKEEPKKTEKPAEKTPPKPKKEEPKKAEKPKTEEKKKTTTPKKKTPAKTGKKEEDKK